MSYSNQSRRGLLICCFSALLCCALLARADEPEGGLSIAMVDPGHAGLQCRVSNTSQGGVDALDSRYEMGAADQGTSADDPERHLTWILFGDTGDSQCMGPGKASCSGDAWYGSHGANAIGYLGGRSYGRPEGLCGSLQLLTQPGLVSADGGAVFAPDLMTAPAGDAITNYLFQSPTPPASLPDNPQVLPAIPPNGAISGTNEGPTSAFVWEGKLYVFYAGGPGLGINADCSVGLAKKSVSWLGVWDRPSTPQQCDYHPPEYRILSRVDYDLSDFTVVSDYASTLTCAQRTCPKGSDPEQVYRDDGSGLADCRCIGPAGTGRTCAQGDPGFVPPSPPGDWRPAPPLGAHFVWVTAVAHDDYLYLYGTGQFRQSAVYLARLPLRQQGRRFPDFVAPYFADTPGLEFYDSTAPHRWTAGVAHATPLQFDGDANAGIGEVSVRWFDEVGAWLMAYARPNGNGLGQHVIVRWATSPTSVWHELSGLDLSLQENQCLYCSNADPAACAALGIPAPNADAFTRCYPDSLYAPDLLPYLGGVRRRERAKGTVTDFTVSYLYSTFQPYDSVLFSMELQAIRPGDR